MEIKCCYDLQKNVELCLTCPSLRWFIVLGGEKALGCATLWGNPKIEKKSTSQIISTETV